jgi:hypothetical protein
LQRDNRGPRFRSVLAGFLHRAVLDERSGEIPHSTAIIRILPPGNDPRQFHNTL